MKSLLPSILLFLLSTIGVHAQTNGWKLVWSDEFDYSGLPNPAKWSYDTGGGGWGNAELQYYAGHRLENSRVENGKLIIEAHNEPFFSNDFTSARLISRGLAQWTYGRIEVRARIPKGRGTWPAIWMLPLRSPLKIPEDGEIDIMEHVGYNPGSIHGTIHCDAYNQTRRNLRTAITYVPDCSIAYHVYTLEWSATEIKMSVDGNNYFLFRNMQKGRAAWPFDEPFYLVLNVAVGGSWGGLEGIDKSVFPQCMEVDYVRVYQKALK
jgi:beta-glucanase (GH16 family)